MALVGLPRPRQIEFRANDNDHRIAFCIESSLTEGNDFSVTIESEDSSWGEFMSLGDMAVLYLWLREALRKHVS